MADDQPIVSIDLHSGGSAHGITTILEFVNGCERKAFLDKQIEGDTHSLGTLTGTLFHALAEKYFRDGDFNPEHVVWNDHDGILYSQYAEQAELKALRTFNAFRSRFPPTIFGKVLEVEKEIVIDDPAVVGCAPYTCRIDLVTKMNKTHCKRLLKEFAVKLQPGVYIIDHKTASALYGNTYERLASSLQGVAYLRAWEAARGKTAAGVLFNFVTTAMTPKHQLIPAANPHGKLATARLFGVTQATAMERWPDMDPSRCNVSRCFDYNSVCPHWVGGDCTGI